MLDDPDVELLEDAPELEDELLLEAGIPRSVLPSSLLLLQPANATNAINKDSAKKMVLYVDLNVSDILDPLRGYFKS